MKVVEAQQAKSEDFFCLDQMAEVSAGVTATRFASATLFERAGLKRELSILDV